jgi:ribosome-associated protein
MVHIALVDYNNNKSLTEGNKMHTEKVTQLATHALTDLKAIDVVTIDIREITTIADTMIICSGRSNRHVKSLAENVITEAKKNRLSYINIEGEREGEWVIADLGDVVVHVMIQTARDFYNLESLWEPLLQQRELKQQG